MDAGARCRARRRFRCAAEIDAYREDVERRARALGLQPLRWPRAVPADSRVRAARRDLREVDRPRRRVLARRVPAGVRRRARPGRARQRADRRRGVRDAPAAVIKGAELRGTRDALDARRRRRARRACVAVPAVGRRPDGERSSDLGGAAAMKANRAYELIVRRGRPGPGVPRRPRRASTTSRSWRSPPARSRCSGTPQPRADGPARARPARRPRPARRRRRSCAPGAATRRARRRGRSPRRGRRGPGRPRCARLTGGPADR